VRILIFLFYFLYFCRDKKIFKKKKNINFKILKKKKIKFFKKKKKKKKDNYVLILIQCIFYAILFIFIYQCLHINT